MKLRHKKSSKPAKAAEPSLLPSASQSPLPAEKPEPFRLWPSGYIVPFRRVIE